MSEHHFENPIFSDAAAATTENVNGTTTSDSIISESTVAIPALTISRDNTDSVVYSIIEKFKRRADFGKKKYNTDLDRKDLSLRDWYNHLHEELFDSILYLEKIMQEIDNIKENRE